MAHDPRFFLVDDEGRRWSLGSRPVTIGASAENAVVIKGPDVALWHARVWRSRGRCWIVDEGTAGDTLVGGRPIAGERELQPGDILQIGRSRFLLRFEVDDERLASLPPRADEYTPQTPARATHPAAVPTAPSEGERPAPGEREEGLPDEPPTDAPSERPLPFPPSPAPTEPPPETPSDGQRSPDRAPRRRITIRPLRIALGVVVLVISSVIVVVLLSRGRSIDVVLQTAVSDSEGIAHFQHPTTGQDFSVLVVDEYSQPRDGQTTLYLQGRQRPHLAFFSLHDEELSGIEFALSDDYLQLASFPNDLFPAGEDQMLAITWFLEEAGFGAESYQRTLSHEEYLAVGGGAEPGVTIALHSAGDLYYGVQAGQPIDDLSLYHPERPRSGQWDWYELVLRDTESGRRIPISVYLHSQPPQLLELFTARVADTTQEYTFEAFDPAVYEAWPGRGYRLPDATLSAGPSPQSDLTWHYRLLDGPGAPYSNWTTLRQTAACQENGCWPITVRLENLEAGVHTIEVYATDDVGNRTETRQQIFVAGD